MLTAFKKFLHSIFAPLLYFVGIAVIIVSIFRNAMIGLVAYVALIPQPNIWRKFYQYTFGDNFLDLLFIAIIFGVFVQKKHFRWTDNSSLIILFILFSYVSLWISSSNFNLPLPITTSSSQLFEWKNYLQMILIYFVIIPFAKDEKDQKVIFLLITVVILFISIRNFRNFSGGSSFSWDKRAGGPFESVGLGANHYGAFIAHYSIAIFGMTFFTKDLKKRMLFLATFLFALHPLLFSYSRGAYLGAAAAVSFFGLKKNKILLLILLAIALLWQVVLPVSVVDRITMTKTENGELESSSAERIRLWNYAYDIIAEHPVIGVGWGGFGLSLSDDVQIMSGSVRLTDTHNFYLKMLCHQGVTGFVLLLFIFFKAYLSGNRLYSRAVSPFHKGLGLGFMGTVIACLFTNLFGDRFSYFVLGSYFWLLWGLVDSALMSLESDDAKDIGGIW